MTIRKAMLFLNGLILAAVIVTGFEIFAFISNINALQDVEQKRLASLTLGDELRQSSENLTANVRLYAVTGDQKALDAYNNIVDVRAGTKPRPSDALIAPGQKRELVGLLKDYGVTEEELALVAGKSAFQCAGSAGNGSHERRRGKIQGRFRQLYRSERA